MTISAEQPHGPTGPAGMAAALVPFKQHGEGVLDAVADRLCALENIDLDDFGAVALAMHEIGYRAADFAEDIPQIMSRAKAMRC